MLQAVSWVVAVRVPRLAPILTVDIGLHLVLVAAAEVPVVLFVGVAAVGVLDGQVGHALAHVSVLLLVTPLHDQAIVLVVIVDDVSEPR